MCIACCNAFSHLCCKKLEIPSKANPINPLIKADIIVFSGILDVHLFPYFQI